MAIIRQASLFDLQDLYDLEPPHRFDEVFSAINIDSILWVVSKKSREGAPLQLNYPAMIHALLIRILERIPTIKDLVRRLRHDVKFQLDCGFLFSDAVPSEASFSRLVTKIQHAEVLASVQSDVLVQVFMEGFITDDTVAIDATHLKARDLAPVKEEKSENMKESPTKRGRKTKAEQEAWRQEQTEKEAALSLYDKKIEDQLDISVDLLRAEVPMDPKWGIKKNSEGKNVFW
ncbi:transposase, partial [Geomicrobium sp. JSM 1781026]|uniref:transposase n=1 Tax=Geomicrobium sp. JSM 1781026 TaxID=3344580 RepID=UPI0035BFDFE0